MVSTTPHLTDLKQLYQTGDRLFDRGQLETALKIFQSALEITLTSNNFQQQINTLNRIGLVYCRLGKYEGALNFLSLALQLAEKVDYQLQVGMIFNDIGETYCLSIEYASALRYYAQALEIFQNISYPIGMGITFNHLGEIYNLLGLFDEALNCCQKSLDIFHRIERKSEFEKLISQITIAKALHNIGEAYFGLGLSTQAKDILELALVMRHKIYKIAMKRFSKSRDNLSEIFLKDTQYYSYTSAEKPQLNPQEEDDCDRSIIAQHKVDLANTINLIELVYRNLGQQQKADKFHQQNLKLTENLSHKYQIYNISTLPFYLRFSSQ
ncbi:MAG: tetratricopeptide repeat protein [Microcoleaceae cyanobacterium]